MNDTRTSRAPIMQRRSQQKAARQIKKPFQGQRKSRRVQAIIDRQMVLDPRLVQALIAPQQLRHSTRAVLQARSQIVE